MEKRKKNKSLKFREDLILKVWLFVVDNIFVFMLGKTKIKKKNHACMYGWMII